MARATFETVETGGQDRQPLLGATAGEQARIAHHVLQEVQHVALHQAQGDQHHEPPEPGEGEVRMLARIDPQAGDELPKLERRHVGLGQRRSSQPEDEGRQDQQHQPRWPA
jgi:hypothetical protein